MEKNVRTYNERIQISFGFGNLSKASIEIVAHNWWCSFEVLNDMEVGDGDHKTSRVPD